MAQGGVVFTVPGFDVLVRIVVCDAGGDYDFDFDFGLMVVIMMMRLTLHTPCYCPLECKDLYKHTCVVASF